MKKKNSCQKRRLTFESFLGIFLIIIVLNFVLHYFFSIPPLETIISVLIIIFIILSLPSLKGSVGLITYSLLVMSIIMFIVVKAPIQTWLEGIRVNITLVSIFTLVPLLGIPIRIGGYLEPLTYVFSRLNPKSSFVFLITQSLTHVLGIVLNIGSISIVHHLSKASPIQIPRLIVSAVNRGFISVIFWSPYFAAMAVVLSMLPITWGSILPYSIGFACVSFIISFLVEWSRIKKADVDVAVEISATNDETSLLHTNHANKKVIELFLLLAFMMFFVLGIEFLTGLNMVIIICLFALLFPFLWSLLYKKHRNYLRELQNHIFQTIPRMRKEVVLFLISGFFSAAFVQTNISSNTIQLLNTMFGDFTMAISYCIVLTIMITSIFGLHPIVPVTIFAASFDPVLLGLSHEYFAVLLLTSWGISNSFSPATASNNLLANLWQQEVTKVSLQWNGKYGLIMALLIPIYLELINI